jgi:hypothetical protein
VKQTPIWLPRTLHGKNVGSAAGVKQMRSKPTAAGSPFLAIAWKQQGPGYRFNDLGHRVISTDDVQLVCGLGAKTGASHFSY